MIEENNSYMTSKLKKIEQFLESKFIHCTKSYLIDKLEIHKNINKPEDNIYDDLIQSDISSFIDKDKVLAHFKLNENCKFDIKEKNINKYIFFQIQGYSNIAEPSEKGDKSAENLDVLENLDNKFLQSEGEETKKTEKVVLKFQLSDGVETVYAFEYEDLQDLKKVLNMNEKKYPKVLIGPNVEIRRGIIYLKNNNIKLL